MVRYQRFGLGVTWTEEYGDADDPTELGWLLGYSPYHRVVDGHRVPRHPVHGVRGRHPRGPAARPQARRGAAGRDQAATGPILVRRERGVGHGGRSLSRTIGLTVEQLQFVGGPHRPGRGAPHDAPPRRRRHRRTSTSAQSWAEWFVGLPLKIILIVVISSIVLVLLRRAIRGITNHVADGSSILDRGPLGESAVGSVLAKASPLASARRAQRARTIGSVLRSTATIVVGSIAFFLILDALGVNIAPFIASAGVVGVALGFGAQSLVKDFLSGLFMLLEDQYGVGDVVDVGPATGTVEAVTLRITKIRDADGTLWYVPNGTMLRVGNKSQGWATAVVEIDVDYFADLDQVRALLTEAASRVVDGPRGGHARPGRADDHRHRAPQRGRRHAAAQGQDVAGACSGRSRARCGPRRATRSSAPHVPLAGQRDLMATHRAGIAPEPRDPHDTPLDDALAERDARTLRREPARSRARRGAGGDDRGARTARLSGVRPSRAAGPRRARSRRRAPAG